MNDDLAHPQRLVAGLLTLACAVMLVACDPGGDRCGPSKGIVVGVIDGDTVDLDSGERVRYLMIDSPEIGSNEECYGIEARTANADLVAGLEVELEYDEECEDRFGRLLAYVTLDGREINTLLVERGFACVLHIPPNGTDRLDEFNSLESFARTTNAGLWGNCTELPCGN